MISNDLLKKKILDEAIHGSLVENDPSLKPVDVQSIDKDIPFEIPNNWKWLKLKSIAKIISGTSYEKSKVVEKGIRILRGGNIVDNKLITREDDVFLPVEYFNEDKQIQLGDIVLVASTGSMEVIGKSAFVTKNMENSQIGAFLRIVRSTKKFSKYIGYIFLSDYYRDHIRNCVKGTAINNIKNEYINDLLIPLPPLEEQEKIVKKIEELFEFIDKKEKNDQEKEKLKALLKEKILDSAIHGKLVENDLSLPAVDVEGINDNVPFDIPRNWVWKRMSDCYVFKQGVQIDIDKQSFIKSDTTPLQFLRIVDFTQNNNDIRYVSNEYDSYILNKNELAIVRYGASAGFICLGKSGVLANNLFKLIPQITIDVNYMFNFLNSSYFQSKVRTHSVAMPSLKFASLNEILLAIPPLEEQKKIVEKIEEWFDLIEQL